MKNNKHLKSSGKEIHFVSERIPLKMQIRRLWKKSWFKYGAPSVILVALVICIICLLPKGEKTTLPKRFIPENEEATWQSSSSSQSRNVYSKSKPQKRKTFEPGTREADIDYLKMHDLWKRDELYYPDFQILYDSVFNGNISYIIRANETLFSNLDPDLVNSNWRAMVNYLIQINSYNDSKMMNQAQIEIRQLCNKIDGIRLDLINGILKALLTNVAQSNEDIDE